MNSSDVIDSSFEDRPANNISNLGSDTDGSYNEASFEGPIVEESLMSNRPSLLSPLVTNRESLNKSAHSSHYSEGRHSESSRKLSSSSEDESFRVIPRTAKPNNRRVRTIASDSEDDFELQDVHPASTSFTRRRAAQTVDSDEDSEDSATSSRDASDNSSSDRSHNQMSSPDKFKKENDTVVDGEIENDNSSAEVTDNIESEDSVRILEKTPVVINVSSSDESLKENINVNSIKNKSSPRLKQVTLDSMVQNVSLKENRTENIVAGDTLYCTSLEYSNQAKLVSSLRTDLLKCKKRQMSLEINLETEEKKLSKMAVETTEMKETKPGTSVSWNQLQANSNAVVPRTFGQRALNTFTAQKALTMDRLQNLHKSLATCPAEDALADDPRGLRVVLMPHQKRALTWLTWRESQKPSGGILADDMGLGKTLTMISLVLKTNEMDSKHQESENSDSESEEKAERLKKKGSKALIPGGTLVICPATLIRQWEGEVQKRCKRNLLNVEVYHGAGRECKVARLAKYDMVITTYKLAMGEYDKKGPLFRIKWTRIILDEAHVVRNHKAQTSVAICGLTGKSRWALTGTPVHNKELDLYALLKFLRCSPFDDLHVWKQWVANKNAGGQDRLNTVMTSIMLRRTKEQLQKEGGLQGLPEKKFELINVTLDSAEKQIYQKVLIFSRTLFTQFLHQREAKNDDLAYSMGGRGTFMQTKDMDPEYIKTYKKVLKMHGSTEVKSHEILVLLLRLRQICCHPSLIVNMLDKENCIDDDIEDDGVDIDILDKLNKLNLDEDETPDAENGEQSVEREDFNTAASRLMNASNPVFAKDRPNEKIRVIQRIIEEKVVAQGDKIIIVSQWTSMLQVVFVHLKQAKFHCEILDGKVPVHKRNEIVTSFNDPRVKTNVLLLSLTAGGVGLNLVGANHLLLLDLHWNPQLESQAQDRIYRVGQKKIVHIYKIVTTDTIEERIKALQENKLAMASDILSGTRPGAGSKLSLDDLKMLFNVGV
ncbi:lodestar [Carabus blaptoides fortunei]